MSSKVPPSINGLHKGERLIPIDFMPKLHPLVHHCYFSYYDVACAYQIHGEGVEHHWANIRKDRSKGPGTKTIEGCPARVSAWLPLLCANSPVENCQAKL
jgi:hypothetical protein